MEPPGGQDADQGGAPEHRAQLRICHEKIGGLSKRVSGLPDDMQPHAKNERWCNLKAAAWCFDDEIYVCEIHLIARHSLHRTQPEDP